MFIHRRTYKGADGRKRRSPTWTVELRTPGRRLVRLAAFADKPASATFGRRVKHLADCAAGRDPLPADLVAWIEGLPDRLRDGLAKAGLLDGARVAAARDLAAHVGDWRGDLEARDCAPRYVQIAVAAVQGFAAAAGIRFLSDLGPDALARHLAGLVSAGRSNRTRNSHLASIRAFCRWAVRLGRLASDPTQHVRTIREEPCLERRALSADEVRRLIQGTAAAGPAFGASGPERATIYRLAVESGLRRGELASLTPASFDLDADPPTVTVAAGASKRRRRDVQPMRPELAGVLRPSIEGKARTAKALPVPSGNRAAAMLRADLRRERARWIVEAADPAARRERWRSSFLAVHDADGAVVDFHALRHTAGTLLGQTGAHPKTIQGLMRHSDINLTMGRYCHRVVGLEEAALAELPDFSAAPKKEDQAGAVRATGTFDARASAPCARPCAQEANFRQISPNVVGRQVKLSVSGHKGEKASEKAAKRASRPRRGLSEVGAGEGIRTLDVQLGKLTLYH